MGDCSSKIQSKSSALENLYAGYSNESYNESQKKNPEARAKLETNQKNAYQCKGQNELRLPTERD